MSCGIEGRAYQRGAGLAAANGLVSLISWSQNQRVESGTRRTGTPYPSVPLLGRSRASRRRRAMSESPRCAFTGALASSLANCDNRGRDDISTIRTSPPSLPGSEAKPKRPWLLREDFCNYARHCCGRRSLFAVRHARQYWREKSGRGEGAL